MQVFIVVQIEELERHIDALSQRITSGQAPHLQRGLVRAARWYMAFIRRRFLQASRGDGTWPDIAPSTKLARVRKNARAADQFQKRVDAAKEPTHRERQAAAVAGLKLPILRDTGALFESLSPGGAGYHEQLSSPLTISVGTSIPYAARHQYGGGRLPQRTILAPPDDATIRGIEAEMTAAVALEIESLPAAATT